MSSLDIRELIELPADAFAEALLAFPGMRLAHPAEPDCAAWQARWESGADFVEFDFSLFEHLDCIWGGSRMAANCPASIVLSLLQHLNARHPGIWLHDPECGMHAYSHLMVE